LSDEYKGSIDGGGVSSTTGTGTLSDQDVATRYGLKTEQVEAFCREFNIPTVGGHYAIPPGMLPKLESWAQEHGYTVNAGGT
jgi:hypothetical protein